jgi:hypothetical protein
MKKLLFSGRLIVAVFYLAALSSAFTGPANAVLINGQNWADSVPVWSGNVQNYAGVLMDAGTTWWLTGISDSDVDENGYAWDEVDNDYVAGWRSSGTASITVYFDTALDDILGDDLVIHIYGGSKSSGTASITVYFDTALDDILGDDLVIHIYGGSKASASVWASSDNVSYTDICSIGGGTPGYFRDEVFDIGGAIDNVHYIRVDREVSGSKTGMFFDSFASVPEPATMLLLGMGVACLRRKK